MIETIKNIKSVGFNPFLRKFIKCPICGKNNDKDLLEKFYFDKNHYKQELKDKIIDLQTRVNSWLNVKLGILCCTCYFRIFGKTIINDENYKKSRTN